MIWREATSADHAAVLGLSRLPMPGTIRLIWGLNRVEPPPECGNLRLFVLETNGRILGTAMTWDWPGGHRYLGGLRFSPDLRGRPARALWTRGYEVALAGCDHAWTAIGSENSLARRLLVSGKSWLPHYTPRLEIRSWFLPLSARNRRGDVPRALLNHADLQIDDHRFAAIASGRGTAYRLARLGYRLGLPGLPPPGRRIRLAHVHADPEHFRRRVRGVKGLDGLIVVAAKGSPHAEKWRAALPRRAAHWDSTLYSVCWNPEAPLPDIPAWKGAWL